MHPTHGPMRTTRVDKPCPARYNLSGLWLVWESRRMDALDPEGVARLFFLQEGGR